MRALFGFATLVFFSMIASSAFAMGPSIGAAIEAQQAYWHWQDQMMLAITLIPGIILSTILTTFTWRFYPKSEGHRIEMIISCWLMGMIIPMVLMIPIVLFDSSLFSQLWALTHP